MRARSSACSGCPSHFAYARTVRSCASAAFVRDVSRDASTRAARLPYLVGPKAGLRPTYTQPPYTCWKGLFEIYKNDYRFSGNRRSCENHLSTFYMLYGLA